MPASPKPTVQDFIQQIKLTDEPKHQILEKLRNLVFEHYPEVQEKMMYGGIIFSWNQDWGGIFVYKNHVSFEFGYGYQLDDPEKLLEGGGKFRRHLKIKTLEEIDLKKVAYFVQQIETFENE